jgi:hypothetical protein
LQQKAEFFLKGTMQRDLLRVLFMCLTVTEQVDLQALALTPYIFLAFQTASTKREREKRVGLNNRSKNLKASQTKYKYKISLNCTVAVHYRRKTYVVDPDLL